MCDRGIMHTDCKCVKGPMVPAPLAGHTFCTASLDPPPDRTFCAASMVPPPGAATTSPIISHLKFCARGGVQRGNSVRGGAYRLRWVKEFPEREEGTRQRTVCAAMAAGSAPLLHSPPHTRIHITLHYVGGDPLCLPHLCVPCVGIDPAPVALPSPLRPMRRN